LIGYRPTTLGCACDARAHRNVETKVHLLATSGLTGIGRPGALPGTRELIAAPYLIVYRVDEPANEIVVLGIVHGARQRPN
jgi:plasmid stabilization system protein ParE